MADPYQSNILPTNIYYRKRNVKGSVVAILDAHVNKRELRLIQQPTRAFKKFDICELITTEENATLGGEVNSIAYLAFLEIDVGGVIKVGDILEISNSIIGEVIGFDLTHMPNHMNVVVKVDEKISGRDLKLSIEDYLNFKFPFE